ncbi:hypothetical protein DP117_25320 [Brasilonema sp. UFV-L1]|nr:hypothetical protein [Brasilonema sp. UFV-L1]
MFQVILGIRQLIVPAKFQRFLVCMTVFKASYENLFLSLNAAVFVSRNTKKPLGDLRKAQQR